MFITIGITSRERERESDERECETERTLYKESRRHLGTVRRRHQLIPLWDKHLLVADTFTLLSWLTVFPRTWRGVLPATARAIPSTLVRALLVSLERTTSCK